MKERRKIAQQRQYLLDKLSSGEVLKSASSLTAPSSFIVPYDPADAIAADEVRHGLVSDLKARGVRVADINVYDVALSVLDSEGIYEGLVDIEPEVSKPEFTDALKDAVDVEKHGRQVGVVFRVVGIKKGTHIPFQSERSGKCA